MAYIGNQPTEAFTTFATQTFSTSATSSYTLDHAVTNENELALFINNVRQQPGSGKAYTAAGTALTLSANTASTDTMYCVFLGRALQTVNPPEGSVGSSQIAATAVTGAKLNTDVISAQTALTSAPADTDEFLVSDAGTIKRIDYSLIKGGGMWEYISSQTASNSSSIDFTTFSSDFRDFCVVVSCLRPATDNQRMYARFFTGTGGSQAIYDASDGYKYAQIGQDNATLTGNDVSVDHMRLSETVGNDTSESANYEIIIYAVDQQGYKQLRSWGVHTGSDSARVAVDNWAGLAERETVDITGIRIYMASGNITSGKFSLYGRKHS